MADTSRRVKIAIKSRKELPTMDEAHDYADEMEKTGQWPKCVDIKGSHRFWAFWSES